MHWKNLSGDHVVRLDGVVMQTIVDVFDRIDKYSPEEGARRALSFYRSVENVDTWTFAELAADVTALATYLHDTLEVRPGERVAFLSPNTGGVALMYLAVMWLGAVVVPLNPTTNRREWDYVLTHAGVRVVLCDTRLSQAIQGGVTTIVDLEYALSIGRRSARTASSGVGADDLAILLYTSGTTGEPKAVALSHYNLLANAYALTSHLGIVRSSLYNLMPLYHAHAVGFGVMNALVSESHLVMTDGLRLELYLYILAREKVEVTSIVPNLLPFVVDAGLSAVKVPSLRFVFVSAAPLSVAAAASFEEATCIRLVHAWGLSEYHFATCMRVDDDAEAHSELLCGKRVPCVGAALPGTEIAIRDEHGNSLAGEEEGELWVRGHSTMLGYFGNESENRRVFRDGWLRTGDIGFWILCNGERMFYVVDRIKEIIIRGGEKYSPLAIERELVERCAALAGRIAVLGFQHDVYGEEVGVYVEDRCLSSDEEIRRAVLALPSVYRPKVVVRDVAEIPKTHTGKVQRRKLQKLFSTYGACGRGLVLHSCRHASAATELSR